MKAGGKPTDPPGFGMGGERVFDPRELEGSKRGPDGTRLASAGLVASAPPSALSPSDPTLFIGHAVADRYIIEEHIASGGFGHVYTARQRSIRGGGVHALKIIPLWGHPKNVLMDLSTRFREREAILNLRVHHPNLLPLLDEGFVQGNESGVGSSHYGYAYMVTPYISRGQSLEAYLNQRGALPWNEIRALFMQICGAIGTLHSHGVMHRDLKPGNVLHLGEVEGHSHGFIYVIDFGSAKIALFIETPAGDAVAHTHPGTNITADLGAGMPFTPGYAPPECFDPKRHGAAFDVFSLGCILAFMVTGQPFVTDGDQTGFIEKLKRRALPSLRRQREDCPEELEHIIFDDLLAIDPKGRPADATACFRRVDNALRACLQTQNPPARTATPRMMAPPPTPRIQRPRRTTWQDGIPLLVTTGIISFLLGMLALYIGQIAGN